MSDGRVPPNRGISLYILKQRHRRGRDPNGPWGKWVSMRYCRNEVDARAYLVVQQLTLRPKVEDAAIFHKGKRL